jgi:hypothetical protein
VPSPTRRLQSIWLLTSWHGEEPRHLCVAGTFKAIYRLALFELKIAEPNLTERAARDRYRLTGSLRLWDRARFEYEEEALYSPIGSGAVIHKVPVRKV